MIERRPRTGKLRHFVNHGRRLRGSSSAVDVATKCGYVFGLTGPTSAFFGSLHTHRRTRTDTVHFVINRRCEVSDGARRRDESGRDAPRSRHQGSHAFEPANGLQRAHGGTAPCVDSSTGGAVATVRRAPSPLSASIQTPKGAAPVAPVVREEPVEPVVGRAPFSGPEPRGERFTLAECPCATDSLRPTYRAVPTPRATGPPRGFPLVALTAWDCYFFVGRGELEAGAVGRPIGPLRGGCRLAQPQSCIDPNLGPCALPSSRALRRLARLCRRLQCDLAARRGRFAMLSPTSREGGRQRVDRSPLTRAVVSAAVSG